VLQNEDDYDSQHPVADPWGTTTRSSFILALTVIKFDPGSVHVGFVVDSVALGQVFLRILRFSPVSSTGAPLQGKTKKLSIFITGLHNKPQGFGASVASAAGPFTKIKNSSENNG
jgi:hypothetical protein